MSELEHLKIDNNSSKAIVMIHGYGANMHDLHGLASYLDPENKYDWIFPNAPNVINLGYNMQGRAWFPVDMMALERAIASGQHRVFSDVKPDGFAESLQVTKAFIENETQAYEKIIIGGFSQGSMLTSHLVPMLRNIEAMILFSGVLVDREGLEEKLSSADPLPYFQSHGKSDPLLNFAEAGNLFELLKLYRYSGEFVPFAGGHEIPMNVIEKARVFLSKFS